MKVTIVKDSIVVFEPAVTAEQIETLKEIDPKMLSLVDSDKNEVYRFATTKEEPSISKFGLTLNPKRLLRVDFDRPVTAEDIQKTYGHILTKIGLLEAQVVSAYEAHKAQVSAITIERLD